MPPLYWSCCNFLSFPFLIKDLQTGTLTLFLFPHRCCRTCWVFPTIPAFISDLQLLEFLGFDETPLSFLKGTKGSPHLKFISVCVFYQTGQTWQTSKLMSKTVVPGPYLDQFPWQPLHKFITSHCTYRMLPGGICKLNYSPSINSRRALKSSWALDKHLLLLPWKCCTGLGTLAQAN